MFQPSRKDTESPPSVLGFGGFYTDSKSWGAGVGARLHLARDRTRLTLGFGTADVRYDYFGSGSAAGDANRSVRIGQSGRAGLAEALFRVREDLYAGIRLTGASMNTKLERASVPPPTLPRDAELHVTMASIAPRLSFDSRDNEFYPTKGWLADFTATVSSDAWGADFDFQRYEAQCRSYSQRGAKNVIAWRVGACAVGGDAPYFAKCLFGSGALLRGYSVGRYQDDALLAGEVEWRRQLRPRWIAAVFGGAGGVAPSLGSLSFDSALPSVGGGIRWVASKEHRINLRVDVGWGKDEPAVYIGVGEAF
jgi:outer membrane protein assembly factor BamA